ncbi:MAG: 16S rRNA (cytosine(1402)-N(4))-methyltransferase RsmH [Chloroflexi bacterium]|nr:16S rRNA (cytosine(1402)-N(4))-methyltransferase RsmH [Chloroflexota bacterium]
MVAVVHTPVLGEEVVQYLRVIPGGRYIDCTLGSGGHALSILRRSSPGGQLLGIDADPEAIELARAALPGGVTLVNANFAQLEIIASIHDFKPVDGILFDLGLSSMQLSESGRGFSFSHDAPLDMRFSPDQKLTAADIVNTYSESDLARLLFQYGEEPSSRRIARLIVRRRPIQTTQQLANLVREAVARRLGRIHPATRTFQALRIAVNQELDNLSAALRQTVGLLRTGGRLVVISYHSLEDRPVKQFLAQESRGCLCPPGRVVCVCGHSPTLKLITKKVVRPSEAEIARNPRGRSARLRAAERI